MKQLIPFYACRKAWYLRHQDEQGRNPDRIWIVLGRTGIETHIGTSEKYMDEHGKEQWKHRGINFLTLYELEKTSIKTVKSLKQTKSVGCTNDAGRSVYQNIPQTDNLSNRVKSTIRRNFSIIVKFSRFLSEKPYSILDVRDAVDQKNFIPTTVYRYGIRALHKPFEHNPERRQ